MKTLQVCRVKHCRQFERTSSLSLSVLLSVTLTLFAVYRFVCKILIKFQGPVLLFYFSVLFSVLQKVDKTLNEYRILHICLLLECRVFKVCWFFFLFCFFVCVCFSGFLLCAHIIAAGGRKKSSRFYFKLLLFLLFITIFLLWLLLLFVEQIRKKQNGEKNTQSAQQ